MLELPCDLRPGCKAHKSNKHHEEIDMRIIKRVNISVSAILLLASIVYGQEQNTANSGRNTVPVTAAATEARVRFTAPAAVVQMRLEVYNSNGEKAFDNEVRGGNVIDWHLQDGQAQPLSEGSYLCVVTTKSLSGRLDQKSGKLTIKNGVASIHSIDATQFTAQQMQAIGPLEENASLTVLKEGESQTSTVIAHDGMDGQIVRGKGALSFRIGDFFSGRDAEQMRLTPDGNLGIGITNPAVRLDVDGMIRASQGIVFPDGSIQYSASRKTFGVQSLRPSQSQTIGQGKGFEAASPDIGGTGTTGKIPKWQDGPNGVLNDSNITEASGAIGINGSPNPSFRLDVNGSVLFRGSNPGFNLVGLRPAGNTWVFQTVDDDGRFRLFGQDNVTPGVERLTINLSTGNVGIGATSPQQNLSVNGALNVDQADLNSGSFNPGLTFGSLSAEGISSRRTAGVGQYGLNFFTNSANRMSILNNGYVGIATTSPTYPLVVANSAGVGQNQGAAEFTNSVVDTGVRIRNAAAGGRTWTLFSSGSGSGIGAGSFNIFDATANASRLSIDSSGKVGIGTTVPGAPLEVQVASGQSLQFRQDSGLVPGINVKTTGGNAGIMRLRNSVEVWPSDDATRAGRVDVRNTTGSPTILLDGQNGNLTATGIASLGNMPGIKFSEGVEANTNITPGTSVLVDSVTINAPASGYIYVSAYVYASANFAILNSVLDFSLSNGGVFVANSKSRVQSDTNNSSGDVPIHLSWVFPVNAGPVALSTSLYFDNFCCAAPATVKSHNLTAIYLPVQY